MIAAMGVQEVLQAILSPVDAAASSKALLDGLEGLNSAERQELAEGLKRQADQLMRTDIQACLRMADLLDELAEATGSPTQRALGLLARANACSVVLGEPRQAVGYYDQAEEIYSQQGLVVEGAKTQIGRIYALANLGQYTQAATDGERAAQVLYEHGEWFHLARLKVNMAINCARLGQDAGALALFDAAKEAYSRLGVEGQPHWLRVELNRAVVLRNLGRFEEAIQSSRTATEMFRQMGQAVSAARAQQSLALTYYVQGRYNEALALLDETREVLMNDGRLRHALLCDLFISDCLLQLRRFPEVIEKCQRARQLFDERGTRYEVGQALLNEASAYAGLGRFEQALGSLRQARRLFETEGNRPATAECDLQTAVVYLAQGELGACAALASGCAGVFAAYEWPVWGARAHLVAAWAELGSDHLDQARSLADQALAAGEKRNLPELTYACRHVLGEIALRSQGPEAGLSLFELAIGDLERLCGRLMVEFRANFLADKERLYEEAVELCLELEQPQRGLEFAERAKSRALLDMLANRLDLSITARSPADQPLVEELTRLRRERDQFYRRLNSGEGYGQRGESASFEELQGMNAERVLALEKRITELWHKLLVRNADYARQAALWQVRAEPVQPYLEPGSLLLEYFAIQGQIVVFLVSQTELRAARLPAEMTQVGRLLQNLWLNLRAAPNSQTGRLAALNANARGLLGKCFNLLLGSLDLAGYQRLIIVPHGPLHYLPFAALHDGQGYLLERFEVSYLPGSSFLRYCKEARPSGQGMAAIGNSFGGRLPFTLQEAATIAGVWGGQLFLEEQSTLENLRQAASQARLLHLAAHGDFRPDNPLFSGLALADGWLTTLEAFNLRLEASLVTLSACQTGRSVVGGGDELLGLARSFLAAGAASLVASLWTVEDRSTAQLMESFYRALAGGESKSAALRQAQLSLLRDAQTRYAHPYYWAPFLLMGDPGQL